jgi:hypothetical protein
MTQQSILDAVRNAIGSPATTEYPDTKTIDCLTRSLEVYSLYRPISNISYITTVANTQAYDFSDVSIFSDYNEASFLRIKEMFYRGVSSSSIIDSAFDADIILDNTLNYGINIFIQESLKILEEKELYNIANYNKYDYKIFNDTTVYLIPKPTSIQNVYFIYESKRTVANLKASEYKDIVDLTFVEAARDLGNKRHKLLQASDPGSGFVMFFGGKHLLEQAEATDKIVRTRLGKNSIFLHG